MIKVLIADDHPMMRTGLAQMLATTDDLLVVGAAAGGEEAIALDAVHRPDVVMMDISMPGMDGIEATRVIANARPDVKVVMLTSFAEHDGVLAALDAGAVGYLLKDAEPSEIVRAVRAAAAGDAPFSPRASGVLLPRRREQPTEQALTSREREVLGLVAEGLANKLIARRLGISEKTVKAHLTSIYSSIGVSDRTQAALWAQRRGRETPSG